MYAIKKFLSGFWGRVALTVVLYFVIFGIMLAAISLLNSPAVIVIIAIAFTVFGWKALSKITPNVFLIMPVGGWIAYYVVKGALSFFLGVFVAPFVMGKALSKLISKEMAKSLANENAAPKQASRDTVQGVQQKRASNNSAQTSQPKQASAQPRNYEFETMLSKIQHMSEDELDEMHQVLLKYCAKAPIPLPDRDYLKDVQDFESSLIEDGSIYGCKTYGEAKRLNSAIVNVLEEMYDCK